MGRKVAINRGGGFGKVFFFKGGALLEEASAFKKYFGPGPRPARVAINLRGFINQELTLLFVRTKTAMALKLGGDFTRRSRCQELQGARQF